MRGEARLAKSGRGARGVLWLITGLAALSACDDSQEEATAPTDVVPAQPTIAPDGPAVLGAVTYGEPVEAAEPLLQRFLERVLATEAIDEAPARGAQLIHAGRFSQGHVNETWRLVVDMDGHIQHAVLKIFADDPTAAANAAGFQAARRYEWPVPLEIARGVAKPYSERPSLLMEYIQGGSLRTRIQNELAGSEPPTAARIAGLYRDTASVLGMLHRRHRRPRGPADRLDRPLMEAALTACAAEGWCGEDARKRLSAAAGKLDLGDVTFSHGDLYESQVIVEADGRLRAFVDLDHVGMADPASDVGALLGHVLYINPVARRSHWGVPDSGEDEQREVGQAILDAYRESAGLAGDKWADFLERSKAYAWLRLGQVEHRYGGEARAKTLLTPLSAQRGKLTNADPFERHALK